jgi:hypothetical protein
MGNTIPASMRGVTTKVPLATQHTYGFYLSQR